MENAGERFSDPAKRNPNSSSPPSFQHGDAQATWMLTDNPTSTPLMTVIVAPNETPRAEACTVTEIPESTSLRG